MTKRNIKTFDDTHKPDITKTQQLVYHYLLSKSVFDPDLKIYKVFKSDVPQTKIAADLKINRGTVSTALKKLDEKHYISEVDLDGSLTPGKWYVIHPYMTPYVGLDIDLIKFLTVIASSLKEDLKHVISVYCLLCKFYDEAHKNYMEPYITPSLLAKVYEKNSSYGNMTPKYYILLSIFIGTELLNGKWEDCIVNNSGLTCRKFKIEKICTILPQNIKEALKDDIDDAKTHQMLERILQENPEM